MNSLEFGNGAVPVDFCGNVFLRRIDCATKSAQEDGGETQLMADMEYAFESGAFVLSAHNLLREEDFEPEYKDFFNDPHMAMWQVGGACILDPLGNYLAEPVYNEETIVYADCYANTLKVKKFFFDGLGHYSRPDVVSLHLNTKHNENLVLDAPSYNFIKEASERFEVELQKVEQLAAQYEDLLSKGKIK